MIKNKAENIKILRGLLEREEADEYDEFEQAKKIRVVKIRTEARLKKAKQSAVRKEKERRKEELRVEK